VTIIIPAYNCSKTLARTLNSLVDQTSKNFRVVLIDDCSTENIKKIVDNYTSQLDLHYIKNIKNIGCGGSRQVGIDFVGTSDDYITFLDADDILIPEAVDLFLNSISNNKGVDIIFSYFALKPINAALRQFNFGYYSENHCFMTHGKLYNTQFLRDFSVHEDPRVGYFDDSFFNLQAISAARRIAFMPKITYIYIKTEGSASVNNFYGKNTPEQRLLTNKLAIEALNRNNISDLKVFQNKYNYIAQLFVQEHKSLLDKELENLKYCNLKFNL
jgi:glycosyltransferase involved in cell wall biosynthesis